MIVIRAAEVELSDAWIDGDDAARWRSGSGHQPSDGARASGSSPIEVEAGCKLPLHTDSAEETIVVVAGTAEVRVGGESALLGAGDLAVVPEGTPHEIRNAGADGLRFIAVYAAADVVTRYAEEVQPDGSRERHTVGGG